MSRALLIGELRGLLDIASDDELAAFAVIARRVMGGGRTQYGPLDLAADKRDFAKEAADEAADLLWYAAIQAVLAGYRRRRPSIDLVREFHERFGQVVNNEPSIGDWKLCQLRIDLLAEELDELYVALEAEDRVSALDALTDLQYVLDGAYLSLGFHRVKDAALAEVHRSNMSKLGEDGKPVLREDGKILKGSSYSPPDLAQFVSAPPSGPSTEFTSAGGGATAQDGECKAWDCYCDAGAKGAYRLHPEAVCADCGDVDHKPDCPWRVVVPGKGG